MNAPYAPMPTLDLAVTGGSSPNPKTSALQVQVAGDHYKALSIQPVEYIHANAIGYFEGNVLKYVTRWRTKGGLADLEKAKHYIELLLELELANDKRNSARTPKP